GGGVGTKKGWSVRRRCGHKEGVECEEEVWAQRRGGV
ncbi:hypothetical protein LEMLEM_LOCUS22136, partial [Lemmus lemmus]